MTNTDARKGTSLIDLILSIAIISLLFGAVYLVYFSIVTSVANIGARDAASSVIAAETETVRNLPYDSVGTVGGVPSGLIPQNQTLVSGRYSFIVQTTVRNIDDPFDGTLGGTPNDTAPADYKMVAITATCPLCVNFSPMTVTTTVAPKNLESASAAGSIFVTVSDANGIGVPEATVNVTNASVTPSVNLTDTTNASGILELVGVPTSTQGYHIVVSKSGFSSDQTYPTGAASNPNPIKPDATVAAQTVTGLTLAIDHTSSLTVISSDARCNVTAHEPFSITGSKTIGSNPTVFKFSTTTSTNASGTITFPILEWDTYSLLLSDATKDVLGTTPLNPTVLNPSSTQVFRFVIAPSADPALLVSAVDAASGAGIQNATVTITKTSPLSQLTGHTTAKDTDWSANKYSSQSGGMDPDSVPGSITLLASASSTYATGTVSTLTSNTIDLGGASSTLYSISWAPATQPLNTSLQLQVAANNDNATWNFVGPDGTSNSFFTGGTGVIPASLSGNRYVRYEIYMSTNDPAVTPQINDVSFDFYANCVPPAQTLFTSLPTGSYSVDVTAANYAENSSTVSVASGFQSTIIQLTHL